MGIFLEPIAEDILQLKGRTKRRKWAFIQVACPVVKIYNFSFVFLVEAFMGVHHSSSPPSLSPDLQI
ncbi:unnamed protein product [Trifolium pratense]|uniref:Uncharacterized protein n=1 Tax=Trifolium pratense TaxID=57577 RepID=A0ACB0KJM1_TRIPR|nr:unnamed protein product [Trifolium pratense]